jgi:hypothetical protein
LKEVKSYIDKNQHLPDMPCAEEVGYEGINLGIEKDKKEQASEEPIKN